MSEPFHHVKKRTLLAIVGCVWLIAVFYTGLGCALAGAGVLFWVMFFRYNITSAAE